MVEKTIEEDQSRANLESLAAGAEAASHPRKQPAAPGPTGTTPGGTVLPKPMPPTLSPTRRARVARRVKVRARTRTARERVERTKGRRPPDRVPGVTHPRSPRTPTVHAS